jgi:hypothetical protein
MAVAFFRKSMLVSYIPNNCIVFPDDPDGEYDADQYPHFEVFCSLHLGTGMEYHHIEENARIIGNIPHDQIRSITMQQLETFGCVYYSANSWD